MITKVAFEIPDHIAGGIAQGKFVRNGGVIQKVAGSGQGGDIVCWLREVASSPVSNGQLMSGLKTLTAISTVGAVASVLNLGATIAFGVMTLNRLKKIDQKLDKLQWTVELGFAQSLSYLNEILKHHEADILGKAKTAAEMAWTAQFYAPDDSGRIAMLRDAYLIISPCCDKVLALVERNIHETSEVFKEKIRMSERLAISEQALNTIRQFRQACALVHLKYSISAEINPLLSVSPLFAKDTTYLQNQLHSLGQSFFKTAEGEMYYTLFNPTLKPVSPNRIEYWAQHFDSNAARGLPDILEQALKAAYQKSSSMRYSWDAPPDLTEQSVGVHSFLDELDGACADIDRLVGHTIEYDYMADHNLRIAEYREMLKIEEAPEDTMLAFLPRAMDTVPEGQLVS